MFTVYKITNKINNKCYIGSSINVKQRWATHKSEAFNENSLAYHYPLYRAFRKYGLENFTFDILKEDFQDINEMQEYEKNMIIFYNSYEEGYNQTYNTSSQNYKKPEHHKGKKIIGISVDNPNNKIYFNSIQEAVQAINVSRSNIGKCIAGQDRYSIVGGYIWRELDNNGQIINNNISIEEKIKDYNNTNPLINGERHTIKDWCKIYNISTSSFYKRRNKGMSVIDAIITPKGR